jgi:hypothetical protein
MPDYKNRAGAVTQVHNNQKVKGADERHNFKTRKRGPNPKAQKSERGPALQKNEWRLLG